MIFVLSVGAASAQELNCKVNVNYSQIQGTSTQVFKTLETSLAEFINGRKWTNAKYDLQEKISCSMNITVKEYADNRTFNCELTVQCNRPVYNSAYHSTLFNFKDANFNFDYLEFDPLEFRNNNIDNNLTAVIAYYAYLIIGLDMDAQAPLGGTEVLREAENIVNAAQTLNATGWKAFDNSLNRYAIISDYLDEGMKPFREMIYGYNRLGLDQMALNPDRGRANITESLLLLKKAKENRPVSVLPQLYTETKKDELVNIYSRGAQKEKEEVCVLLTAVNPSLANEWNKIKTIS